MKIKNLLLLSVFMMLGTSAFATVDVKQGNVGYAKNGTGTGTAADPYQLTVVAAFAADNLTIEDAFTFASEMSSNSYKVVGFTTGWENSGETGAVSAAGMKTLSIKATNMANLNNAFTGLTALETLTVTNGTWTDITNVTSSAPKTTLKTLDLSGLSAVKKITQTLNGTAWTKLTSVTLPANTEEIPASFFEDSKVTAISLPAKVTKLPNKAYKGAALESIDLSKITEIGESAFENCVNAKLTTLEVPATVTKIGDNAFKGMTALESVSIKNETLTEIGAWFAGDNAIKSLTIEGSKITKIAANAFTTTKLETLNLNKCTALATITSAFSSSNKFKEVQLAATAIESETDFADLISGSATTLTKVGMPSKLTKIADNTFKNFANLKAVDIPKKVATIGNNAFEATGLTSIAFNGNLKHIGNQAFYNCKALVEVDFSKAVELLDIGTKAFDGIDNNPENLYPASRYVKKFLEVDLNACVWLESVADDAFPANPYTKVLLSLTSLTNIPTCFTNANAKKTLKNIGLPGNMTTLAAGQFAGFEALKGIDLPKNLVTIQPNALKGMTALKSISIPSKVTSIGTSAFADCPALESVDLSNAAALTIIDAQAFDGCTALATVDMSGIKDGKNLKTIGGAAFRGTALTEIEIPASVTTLSVKAFQNCQSLTKATATGLTYIANNTFEGCAKLGRFVIGKAVKSIGAEAFKGCTSLKTVPFLHDGTTILTLIDDHAFEGCSSLKALDLSETKLSSITSTEPFKGCTSLATITFSKLTKTLSSNNLFADCPIEELNAPNVTFISNLFGNFWDESIALPTYMPRDENNANTTLKTVVLGGAAVPANAFLWCTALETVEIGKGTIAGNAFANCTSLESVSLEAKVSPSAGDVAANAFDGCIALKTFTYEPEVAVAGAVHNNAFSKCVPYIHFVTTQKYQDANPMPPYNTSYEGNTVGETIVKTVQDKANANQSFGKFYNASLDVRFKASAAKLYTVYVDDDVVYYQACRTIDGYYDIPAGSRVIVKTAEPTIVSYKIVTAGLGGSTSVAWDDLYCSKDGDDIAAVMAGVGLDAGEYIYRLTNTADQGFGFTHFTGTTVKAGQFFLACTKRPASGRLSEVWLDEDGNVEGNATAIQTIEKAAEQNDGAIYNLQGVRVQKAQKGLYIQNGKKFVVK